MSAILPILLLMFLLLVPASAFADVDVIEGEEAKQVFEQQGEKSKILSQINKVFVFLKPDEKALEEPAEITIEEGEYIFIKNDEDKTVHNVYDTSDHSWVLKKQLPAAIAAIKFDEVGTHDLRCAIHPKMKVKVNVVKEGKGAASK